MLLASTRQDWLGNKRGDILAGLVVAAGMAVHHYTLIRNRERAACFRAFNLNNWLGAALFVGLAIDYGLRASP